MLLATGAIVVRRPRGQATAWVPLCRSWAAGGVSSGMRSSFWATGLTADDWGSRSKALVRALLSSGGASRVWLGTSGCLVNLAVGRIGSWVAPVQRANAQFPDFSS